MKMEFILLGKAKDIWRELKVLELLEKHGIGHRYGVCLNHYDLN